MERTRKLAWAPEQPASRRIQRQRAMLVVPPSIVTAILWITTLNQVSAPQVIAAYGLALVPWIAFSFWKRQKEFVLPAFACVAFMYWVYYAVPLFWGNRDRGGVTNFGVVTDDSVTAALWMALVGVIAMWIGTRTGFGKRFRTLKVRDLLGNQRRWMYLRLLLVFGAFPNLYPGFTSLGGADLQQLLDAFTTFVPLVIFLILFRNWLRGSAARLDKYAVIAFLVVEFITGVASGWLGAMLTVGLASLLAFLLERKKLPMVPIVLAIVYALFFQAGKNQFRSLADRGSNPLDRVSTWFNLSLSSWQNSVSSGDIGPQLIQGTVMRASLLTQTANVEQFTPGIVPYQYGSTYSYVIVGLVPRAVWSDKPSANDANRFYQVAYGLTTAGSLQSVSISVGVMTESYINFGWPGIVIIMFLMGVILDVASNAFLTRGSGLLFSSIGIAILLQYMTIEYQMALYTSGILQKLLLTAILLWSVTCTRLRADSAEFAT